MGKYIDGLYYQNDQVEPDGNGGWRVKRDTPVVTVEEIEDAEQTGGTFAGGDFDGLPVETVIEAVVETPAPDVVVSLPPAHETKIITAKPKPGKDNDGGYDTK